MRVRIKLDPFPSNVRKTTASALIIMAFLVGCATPSPPPLATPELFEEVACDDLVRIKYDQEVRLLKLSGNLQRARAASSRGSSVSDGLSQLGDSIANLGHAMRINEIRDEITAARVEIAAIDYNLSNRCRPPTR